MESTNDMPNKMIGELNSMVNKLTKMAKDNERKFARAIAAIEDEDEKKRMQKMMREIRKATRDGDSSKLNQLLAKLKA